MRRARRTPEGSPPQGLGRRRWLGGALAGLTPLMGSWPASAMATTGSATPNPRQRDGHGHGHDHGPHPAQSPTHGHDHGHGPVNAADERRRQRLLTEAEALMATGQAAQAQERLDEAARIAHSPDTELALVRCYLQQGQYRRALAFGAHAAGAHRREWPAGNALYLWLVHLGGQREAAAAFAQQALALAPEDAALRQLQAQLRAGDGRVSDPLLRAPLRAAPYAWGDASEAQVRAQVQVLGTALLSSDGALALVASDTLPPASKGCLLRAPSGQTVRAERSALAGLPEALTLLRLPQRLPGSRWSLAPRAPFPGTAASCVGHASDARGLPAWPLLQMGFLGGPSSDGGHRRLGVPLDAGVPGGAVLDGGGRLCGLAIQPRPEGTASTGEARLQAHNRPAQMVALDSGSRPELAALWPIASAASGGAAALPQADVQYEAALPGVLQVLA